MTKLFYWDGIIGANEPLDRYAKIIEKLQAGDYRGADLDLKKLPDYPLYSVRVNDADRLLFTTITGKNNEHYLLLLEEIKNHDYQKSHFLKPGVLARFMENKAFAIVEQIFGEQNFVADTGKELSVVVKMDNSAESFPMTYYKNQFIELNMVQHEAVYVSLPAKIEGGPGAGKTTSAMACIENKVKQYQEEQAQGKRILYLTRSENLVQEMAEAWQHHPSADERIQVEFKTNETLLREQDPTLEGYQTIGNQEFEAWLEDYKKRKKVKGKSAALPEDFLSQEKSDAIYQEFRIISAYSHEQYLKLGQRESLFNDKVQKEWLWNAYQAYQVALQEKHQLNPAFKLLDTKDQYDFIVVDEAQDLSLLELKQLYLLAKEEQIAFCLDPHQSIADAFSKRAFLQKLSVNMKTVVLPGSYRCSKPVLEFSNWVLLVEFFLTGGTSGKDEVTRVNTQYSKEMAELIQWHEPTAQALNSLKKAASKRSDWAVITNGAYRQEAIEKFATPLVFTVEEIKGLEYATVIIYQLLEDDIFYLANKLLPQQLPDDLKSKVVHRPKKGEGKAEYGPPFNQLYTALTRTTDQLIIVQNNSHRLERLIAVIQQALPEGLIDRPLRIREQAESSQADWEEQRKNLLLKGHKEQARGIEEKLNKIAQASAISEVSILLPDHQQIATQTLPLSTPAPPQSYSNKKKKATKKIEPLTAQEVFPIPQKPIESSAGNGQARPNMIAYRDNQRPSIKSVIDYKESRKFEVHNNQRLSTKSIAHQDSKLQKNFKIACQNGNLGYVKKELKKGMNVNYGASDDNMTPLYAACQNGHFKIAKALLKHKAEIDLTCHNGATALLIACHQRHFKIASLLLENGADVHKASDDKVTPLYISAERGCSQIAQALIAKGANVNQAKINGMTPLAIASQENHIEVVRLLLRNGADPNAVDNTGTTPLILAATNGYFDVMQELIQKGALVNQANADNVTPLYMACQNGHLEVVELLLKNQADANVITKYGKTALCIAVQKGHDKIVELLLEYKADTNFIIEGETLLSLARKKGYTKIVNMLEAKEKQADLNDDPLLIAIKSGHDIFVQQFLDLGVNPNLVNKVNGIEETPLCVAIRLGRLDITKMLLTSGANPNLCILDEFHISPLLIAISRGYPEIADELLNAGARIDDRPMLAIIITMIIESNDHKILKAVLERNPINLNSITLENGHTFLSLASLHGHVETVKVLVSKGADITIATKNGETPFLIARKKGHTEVATFLLQCMLEARQQPAREEAENAVSHAFFQPDRKEEAPKMNLDNFL